MRLKVLVFSVLIWCAPFAAWANCTGQSPSGYACGNNTGTTGQPGFNTLTSIFDKGFGSTQGTIVNRGSSTWAPTAAPILGLNGTAGGSVTLEGSTSGSALISVAAAAGTVTFQLPSTNGSNTNILSTDGSGHLSWVAGGAGTVTSVGLSLPGIFSVTGSPVTGSGTITATLASQSENLVWASPNGSSGAPTFRSLVGADLPDPTTSALGGVEANNTVSHEWINQINTSGVPQLSQPAFSDISGQATLSQLPSIGNNTVVANDSGSTGVPQALTASNVLDMIGSTQGDILYRSNTGWTVLAPGTNGQLLQTAGAGANPAWATVSGSGTVTSVACGNGTICNTFTTSGTVKAPGALLASWASAGAL